MRSRSTVSYAGDGGRQSRVVDQAHWVIGMGYARDPQRRPAHPRDILGPSRRVNAAAVAVAHNHPSSNVTPNRADRQVTAVLRDACTLVGILRSTGQLQVVIRRNSGYGANAVLEFRAAIRMEAGRGAQTRTGDLLLPKQARYRLRHAPRILNSVSSWSAAAGAGFQPLLT